MRPAQHVRQLGVVEAFERDGIELDLKACPFGGLDAGHHARKIAPPGDCAKLVRVERIHRHVDAPDPAIRQLVGETRELRPVGGQGQFLKRAAVEMARKLAHEVHDVLAHQRLAAGEPQLAHAFFHEDGAQPVEFLEAEQIALRQERHVFRHAVSAAEVAAVGDRHAQIRDRAAERIDHGAGIVHMPARSACPPGHAVNVGDGRVRFNPSHTPRATRRQSAAQAKVLQSCVRNGPAKATEGRGESPGAAYRQGSTPRMPEMRCAMRSPRIADSRGVSAATCMKPRESKKLRLRPLMACPALASI